MKIVTSKVNWDISTIWSKIKGLNIYRIMGCMIPSMILHAVDLPFNCNDVYIDTVDGRTPALFGVYIYINPMNRNSDTFPYILNFNGRISSIKRYRIYCYQNHLRTQSSRKTTDGRIQQLNPGTCKRKNPRRNPWWNIYDSRSALL